MKIHSKIKDYALEIYKGLLDHQEQIFKPLADRRRFYFIDENFYRLYQKKLDRFMGADKSLIIPAYESNKEYSKLTDYYQWLIQAEFKRNDVLMTFGGGTLQDISGFVASTLYRGVPWVFFPTTLLAQADSCIGSKTSINFGENKNLIGTFYPPDHIYVDPDFCETLSPEYFNSGLGEMIKFHLLSDSTRYSLLKKYLASGDLRKNIYFNDMVLSTLEIKKSYFESDEFDTGRRNLLNYGHCFGHALESASHFAISHGEAVIIGMGFANLMARKRGFMSEAKYQEFENILRPYYPSFNLVNIGVERLIEFMKRDKKRVGKDLTIILGRDIGDFKKFNDITEIEIVSTYQEFLKLYQMVNV